MAGTNCCAVMVLSLALSTNFSISHIDLIVLNLLPGVL